MKRPIVFFVLAGFAAVLASIVVYSALKRKDADIEKAMVKSTEIVVAAHDLPLGTRIDQGAVKLVRWPRDNVPVGASADSRSVVGSVVKLGIVENEPIVASKLFSGELTSGVLPLLIPAGMRAMSVPVDEVSDIAGFVQPHSRVDVLVSLSSGTGGPGGSSRSKVVLENVEVLAVAQTIEKRQDQPEVVKVVTLLVNPEEAERLALASREGTLRLAMRNYNDDKIVLTSGTDVPGILRAYSLLPVPTVQKQHPPAAPVVRPFEVEILRNGQSRDQIGFAHNARPKAAVEEGPTPVSSAPAPRHEASAAPASAPAAESASLSAPIPKTIDVR